MTRLGAVMSEAIVHHYGRDELLRRLAHPFWFQSFGAVMGMDWHSSGITTSVIGALKRGLAPLSDELGIHVCGGRGKHSRQTPQELVSIGERVGFDGWALANASRLVAKVDSAAVQDGFDLYLHGFVVTNDGQWVVVQQGMNGDRKQARRYHWLSEGLKSFVQEPHSAIDGVGQGEIVNLTDRRAEASRRGQLDVLQSLGPDGIARELSALEHRAGVPATQTVPTQLFLPHLVMPARHDVRPSDVLRPRLYASLAAAADRGAADFAELLFVPGVGARTVRALAMVAEVMHGALLVCARRQGPASVSGAPSGLRSDNSSAEIGGPKREARPRGRAGCAQTPRRPGSTRRAPHLRSSCRGADSTREKALPFLRRPERFRMGASSQGLRRRQ
jgi:hypothetical protein